MSIASDRRYDEAHAAYETAKAYRDRAADTVAHIVADRIKRGYPVIDGYLLELSAEYVEAERGVDVAWEALQGAREQVAA